MRFRQVHLDFHTSEAIDGIGDRFSAAQFQEALRLGHVNSITVFSKCHHGWAYHPSNANEIHPHLKFDLLGEQIKAAHAIGVNTPVYISAGLDEKEARRHPDWLIRDSEDRTNWIDSFLKPGYHQFCMNTPYLDVLCKQIEEVVENYDADGIFLDIVGVRHCVCNYCIRLLVGEKRDPANADDVLWLGERTYANYTRRARQSVDKFKPGLPLFHNGGHIVRGRRDLAHYNTHLELESLPTGGWGYDHFPLSARYASTLGLEYLGMTGKFHTNWGEFGGFKHPNALRYETALSIANGAKVSIGDQLHPSGQMDIATYDLIGAAYAEVERVEEWCGSVSSVADIGLLTVQANGITPKGDHDRSTESDVGAVRILLEGHYLFDVIDNDADFSRYKVIILPDIIKPSQAVAAKLAEFIRSGGKVLATGLSGIAEDGYFQFNLGAVYKEPSKFQPDYIRPEFSTEPLKLSSFVMYGQGQVIAAEAGGTVLAWRENPYFNREWNHFCSHQHTPSDQRQAGPGITEGSDGIYISWAVFSDYATKGSLILKKIVQYSLDRLLASQKSLVTDLPAQGIVTLSKQKDHDRHVLHLLYASPVNRGKNVEVIEDLVEVGPISVHLRGLGNVRSVRRVPSGEIIPFSKASNEISFEVPRFECHQMVEIS